MDDLLTTRQVLELLKIDRITVYRMLQDGRLNGVKIGQQWRFPRREVERLLSGGEAPQAEAAQVESSLNFPTHCVQTIQDLFSDVSQISALIVDLDGEPLTETTHPCSFCQMMLQNPDGQKACRNSWRAFAQKVHSGEKMFTCHAGLQYIAAPVEDDGKTIGLFLAGQFHWQPVNAQEETARLSSLAAAYQMDSEKLLLAAADVPLIAPAQHAQVESWPVSAARAVQSILRERTGFVNRLQQIANLSQIS
jgi:excisionase family DNA binding protein